MDLTFVCVPPAILFAAWGFGSLLRNLAKVRGQNTRRAFWSAAISYALLLIVMAFITYLISSVARVDNLDFASLGLFSLLTILGVFSPLGILFLRWKHPETFKPSTPGQAAQSTPAPVALEPKQASAS